MNTRPWAQIDDERAAVSTFREDGAAALEWVASYLEPVREYPVLSRVEPGQIRAALPPSPPEAAEPFAAVLRDLDAVLMPGITHWQSPRYFAYFATTGAEPGILAELLIAGLNQVGILWRASPALQELEEVTLDWLRQLLGLPERLPRPHRGHGLDEHDGGDRRRPRGCAPGGASSSARSTRTRRSRRRRGCSSSTSAPWRPTRRFACDPTCSISTDACAVVATIGTT